MFMLLQQVPVLASPEAFSFPLAHTAAITEYIADRHPSLLPSAHRNEIKRMVTKMHELNFFTLSFSGSPGAAAPDSPPPIVKRLETPILERLEREDISEEYRKALEYKLSMYATSLHPSLHAPLRQFVVTCGLSLPFPKITA